MLERTFCSHTTRLIGSRARSGRSASFISCSGSAWRLRAGRGARRLGAGRRGRRRRSRGLRVAGGRSRRPGRGAAPPWGPVGDSGRPPPWVLDNGRAAHGTSAGFPSGWRRGARCSRPGCRRCVDGGWPGESTPGTRRRRSALQHSGLARPGGLDRSWWGRENRKHDGWGQRSGLMRLNRGGRKRNRNSSRDFVRRRRSRAVDVGPDPQALQLGSDRPSATISSVPSPKFTRPGTRSSPQHAQSVQNEHETADFVAGRDCGSGRCGLGTALGNGRDARRNDKRPDQHHRGRTSGRATSRRTRANLTSDVAMVHRSAAISSLVLPLHVGPRVLRARLTAAPWTRKGSTLEVGAPEDDDKRERR